MMLSREEVLVRQLDTAAWLWMFGYDPVSIHMLARAAHKCLDDVGKSSGIRPKITGILPNQDLDSAYDFFRHASSNLRIHLDFAPSVNQWILWDSINTFNKVFRHRTVYMKTFAAFTAMQLAASNSAKLQQACDLFFPNGVKIEDFRQLDAVEFFDKISPLFATGA